MTQKYTNRLSKETSLYLLQHAHNPVDWYPWGNEALQKAKSENKIILVSIGYAACHWCHVMEKESFENEDVAKKMNKYFINIKIDREERPDLDHVYMDAVQTITGSGGWPLNVFLTPDTKPFFGGTYFPPSNAYNRPSWTNVLENISKAWAQRKNEITSQAENLLEHLQKANQLILITNAENNNIFTKESCHTMAKNILKQADTQCGGFGKSPKFPQTFTIEYLFQYYYFTQDKRALQQALLSIDKMLDGGIYDQIGGGFYRYSTDNEWLVPHFEKMLYDNALLLGIISDAYKITQQKKYKKAIEETINFCIRELMDADGGFYAALDADSEGEEGKYYIWEKKQIEFILKDKADLFCKYYSVFENGNMPNEQTYWANKNILHVTKNLQQFASENNVLVNELASTLNDCNQKLLTERLKRIRPITDDKILLGWNAMMVTALCKASAALDNKAYKILAEETMQFLLQKFKQNAKDFESFHTYKNRKAKYPAFLDDYAFLIQACIQLQELTSNSNYLFYAKGITSFVIDNFTDEANNLFLFTHKNQQDIFLQKKEIYDGATASGNSVMAQNLFYISIIFDKPIWQDKAKKMILTIAPSIIKYPTSFGIWASIVLQNSFDICELVIMGKNYKSQLKNLLKIYLPAKVLQSADFEDVRFPLLKKKPIENNTLLYCCKQYSCKAPVATIEQLLAQINA